MADQSCCTKFKVLLSKCCCFAPCFYQMQENNFQRSQIQQVPITNINQTNSMLSSGFMGGALILNRRKQAIEKGHKWKMVQGSYIYEDKTCSICLAESANLKLQCNHFFHKRCLWLWFKDKKSCPNCRNNTNVVNVFCQVCFFQYYTNTLQDQLKSKSVDQFGLPIITTCQSCQPQEKKQKDG